MLNMANYTLFVVLGIVYGALFSNSSSGKRTFNNNLDEKSPSD